ncbi:MAG: relaxase/mobilization nuclease domain-containing protein [Labilibaculum sp.]|nr:relaxase/mobilization nuclease domain-containing protein [Labilibaculum sp.]MBI9059092.1 relaxase/mobilization nuclease domain-containing protein [Labilibaculum sp.]
MIAKIVKGQGFAGVVNYILDKKKGTELLDSEGLRLKNKETMIESFRQQSELNPRISKPVYHISLSFSAKDKWFLADELMVNIARQYMCRMNICETQFLIVRHFDKEHPHIHMVINRVDYHGKTISDRNDRIRSEKICKNLTKQHGLYFAKGKEQVKVNRLHEPDKSKYEIYNALQKYVPESGDWLELVMNLEEQGISIDFKTKGKTAEVQGVRFIKNGLSFNGSKIDRQFSFSKIDAQLKQNVKEQSFRSLERKLKVNSLLSELLIQSHKQNCMDEFYPKRKQKLGKKIKKKGFRH